MEEMDSRVARLEFRSDAQDKEIASLRNTQETFGKSLKAIEQTLLQIKYAIYGGAVVFAVQALGLKEAILKFLAV